MFKKLKIIILFTFLSIYSSQAKSEFDVNARTAILQDYLSGEILFEKDPDSKIFPASMTKIMTSIIVFDLLKKGELSLDDKFFVSENAWRWSQAGYSSMFIMVNDQVSVENLLRGIIVASGNDACIALYSAVLSGSSLSLLTSSITLLISIRVNLIVLNNTHHIPSHQF